MGLGLPKNEGGDFKDICKYDARAGRMFRIDRADGESTPVEITNGFAAIFDLANIQVGWVKFSEGGAPSWAMVKMGEPRPARPSPEHRAGFRLDIRLAKASGGDLREFGSAAGCVITSMDKLFDAFESHPDSKAGKLPIVGLDGTTMVKSGMGAKTSTNYAPNFVIKSWVDRPAELGAAKPEAAKAAPAAAATAVASDEF